MERLDENPNESLSYRLERLEAEVATLTDAVRTDDRPNADLREQFETVAGELQALLAETTGGHGAIDTRTGGRITPLEPEPGAISLEDVAHALANLTRFAGQGKGVYSVARHSVHVSREVEARGGGRPAQRWALLHDASEAYLADVPAPVKRSLPGYTRAETRLQAAVQEAFGIELTDEEERLVDAADGDVGRYELARHFPHSDHESPTLEYDPADLERDGADDEERFLRRARELDCY